MSEALMRLPDGSWILPSLIENVTLGRQSDKWLVVIAYTQGRHYWLPIPPGRNHENYLKWVGEQINKHKYGEELWAEIMKRKEPIPQDRPVDSPEWSRIDSSEDPGEGPGEVRGKPS